MKLTRVKCPICNTYSLQWNGIYGTCEECGNYIESSPDVEKLEKVGQSAFGLFSCYFQVPKDSIVVD